MIKSGEEAKGRILLTNAEVEEEGKDVIVLEEKFSGSSFIRSLSSLHSSGLTVSLLPFSFQLFSF